MDEYKQNGAAAGLTNAEKIAFRKIMDTSNKMFNDLKEVANKYIEINDLNSKILYNLGPEQLEFIQFTLERFSIIDLKELTMLEKKKLFRQVQFFYQYIQMLMENGNAENQVLQEALETLVRIKRKMLKNPDLLYMFAEKKELTDDKETMKLAKAQAKQMLKQIKLDDRRLSIAEMKKAQLIFTSDTGTGSRGQFFMLLLVKLWEFLKKTFTRSGREATRAEKIKRAEERREE